MCIMRDYNGHVAGNFVHLLCIMVELRKNYFMPEKYHSFNLFPRRLLDLLPLRGHNS